MRWDHGTGRLSKDRAAELGIGDILGEYVAA